MISLRSAASTPRVSADGGTPFSHGSYLDPGIGLGRPAMGVLGATLDRMGLSGRVFWQGVRIRLGWGFRGRTDGGEGGRIDVQGVMAGRQVPVPVVDEGR